MPPNFSNFSHYDMPRPSQARSPSARSSGSPGWPDSQNESPAPRAGQPASPVLAHTTTHYATSTNARYQSAQHPILGQSPHSGNQPVVYPVSSQRTPMNDGPYPSTHDTFSRQIDPPAINPVAHRGSDPPRMQLDHTTSRCPAISAHSYSYSPETTMGPNHHTHRPGNFTVPPFNQGSTSHQHPPRHLSGDPRDMHSMLSEFSISPSTLGSPPSSASAASPYFDKTLVRPSMSTMQMKSNSLEAIEDLESLSTLKSFYHPTTDVPSRSSSSQSSASRSASESDSSSQISSIPNGMGTTGRLSNSASTSSAGGALRKNKMHQCPVCRKSFPRPSGLETHMNSHTGARPYKCPLPGCDKAFAVRSNAKRHYKTHGLPPAAESHESQSTFSVDFNTPHVTYNYEPRGDFPELKWVQPGQTTRMSRDEPDSPSGSDEVDSGGPSNPLYPPGPSFGSRSRYDGTHPYHSK